MTTRSTDAEIEQWLACASLPPEAGSPEHAPGAGHARTEWTDRRVALLPCGTRFCAVRLPARLVHAAAGTDLTEIVAATMLIMSGPVFLDAFSTVYYALVPVVPQHLWQHNEVAPLLGTGTYVGVPRTDRIEPPGTHWLVLPHSAGDLCALHAVDTVISQGRRELTRREGG